MSRARQTDEAVVEKARRLLAAQPRLRWGMLLYAIMFLGLSGYFTVAGIQKIERYEADQLSMGFIYGLALAVIWTSFGLLGALCLGKFLVGFRGDFRTQELLVRYHDRLRDLRDLPDQNSCQRDDPTSGSEPMRAPASRTSSAVGGPC